MKKLFAIGAGRPKSKSVQRVEGTVTFRASCCGRNISPLPGLISLSHGEHYLSFLATLKIFSFHTQRECLEIDTLGLHSSLGSSKLLEETQERKKDEEERQLSFPQSGHMPGECACRESARKLHLVERLDDFGSSVSHY